MIWKDLFKCRREIEFLQPFSTQYVSCFHSKWRFGEPKRGLGPEFLPESCSKLSASIFFTGICVRESHLTMDDSRVPAHIPSTDFLHMRNVCDLYQLHATETSDWRIINDPKLKDKRTAHKSAKVFLKRFLSPEFPYRLLVWLEISCIGAGKRYVPRQMNPERNVSLCLRFVIAMIASHHVEIVLIASQVRIFSGSLNAFRSFQKWVIGWARTQLHFSHNISWRVRMEVVIVAALTNSTIAPGLCFLYQLQNQELRVREDI